MTSGSTGTPKVTRTAERHLLADVAQIAAGMDIGPGTRQLGVIPLSHSYGLSNLLLPLLWQGSPLLLLTGFSPAAVAEDARAFGAETFAGVPFMLDHVARHVTSPFPPTIRTVLSAGAPLTFSTVSAFHARTGRKVHSFYGSSETGGICYDDSEALDEAVPVGRPLGAATVTLLDTPGHSDFSEDTYRTLFAADSVVMVIDAAKGVEPQTLKLFEACRLRRLPVLTFVNKLDLPGRDPFDLLHELESVLHLHTVPFNWPIGSGDRFQGVFVPASGEVRLYEKQRGGAAQSEVEVLSVDDPGLGARLGEAAAAELRETRELLLTAGTTFDREAYLAGAQSPVFFGSALSSFGLEPFLRALMDLAPPPGPRMTVAGDAVDPSAPFSGFIFKVQANMNRKHRDRVSFLRVSSGVLNRDDKVVNARTGETLSVSRLYTFFGGERHIVDRAYPGDIVGLVNPGRLTIGDTLSADGRVEYPPIPRFAAEYFGAARLRDLKFKQFEEGIRQLEEEGLMQVVFPIYGRREPVLG
ncbi:MAG: AMP-binding protein, partial [Vicinamibacteria bacterium]